MYTHFVPYVYFDIEIYTRSECERFQYMFTDINTGTTIYQNNKKKNFSQFININFNGFSMSRNNIAT